MGKYGNQQRWGQKDSAKEGGSKTDNAHGAPTKKTEHPFLRFWKTVVKACEMSARSKNEESKRIEEPGEHLTLKHCAREVRRWLGSIVIKKIQRKGRTSSKQGKLRRIDTQRRRRRPMVTICAL